MIPYEEATARALPPERQVIVTKVRPPLRRRDLVSRRRLVEYLSANVDRKLILVSAAAGYGKTTLLVDFLHESGLAACWYRMDDADTDLTVFFEHLVASLRQRYPGVCERTLVQVRTDPNPDPEVLVGSLINEISEQIHEFFLLVLDDFHRLDDSVLINAALDFFLRYLPDNCRVVVCSRTLPRKLTLTRLAGEGQVLGVGQEHLRFSPEEIRDLVRHLHHDNLSLPEAQELATSSEGWIAALVMGSAKLLDGVRTGLDLPTADHGQLFDYLASEVMAGLPPDTKEFLMATAILEALNPEVCDAVSGRSDSGQMLELLEEQNLFVARMEGSESWYRYHGLFQDFLCARLAEMDDPERPERHRRAAAWYAAHGQTDLQIHHLLEAKDLDEAAERIEAAVPDAVRAGRWRIIVRWVSALPEEVRLERPRLLADVGIALAYLGRLPESIAAEGKAVERYTAQGDNEGAAGAYMHRSYSWRFMGQIDAAVTDARRALELTERPEGIVASGAHRNLGACLSLKGEMRAAAEELGVALVAFEAAGHESHAADVHTDLSAMYQLSGDVARALHHAEEARNYFAKVGNLGHLALALNNMGTAYYAMGQLEPARGLLEEAVQTAHLVGVHRTEALATASLADVEVELDQFDEAVAHYESALVLARDSGESMLVGYCLASLAEAHRLAGRLADAQHHLAAAREEMASNRSAFEAALLDYVRGTIALDRGELERAAEHLEDAARSFASMGARREQARALLYRVAAAHRKGEMAHAERLWREAYNTIREFGYPEAFAPQKRRLPEVFARENIHDVAGAAKSLGISDGSEAVAAADAARAAVLAASRTDASHLAPDLDMGSLAEGATARVALNGTGASEAADYVSTEERKDSALAAAASRVMERSVGHVVVRAFGTPEVARAGRILDKSAWTTSTARELFFYLVDRPDGALRDDTLLAFWPESTMPRATSAFHTTMYRVRRAVSKEAIGHEGDRYYIALENLEYDVALFEQLVEAAGERTGEESIALLERAVALVRGEYLAGVDAEWAMHRREELLQTAVAALTRLGRLQLSAGVPERAVGAYVRALEMEPLDEDAHRSLMRAYAKSGDRVKALQHYDSLVALLEREVGITPDATTVALYQAIKQKEQLPAA